MKFQLIPAVLISASLVLPNSGIAGPLKATKVTDDVWAIVGPNEQRNADNLANNATFGVIETDAGAVLIDPGGSWQGAQALHEVVKGLTDQPVTHVINTGGQDHRWLGNGYWQAQGATVIASMAAVADHKDRSSSQLSALSQMIGERLQGTEPAFADVTFEDEHTLEIGGMSIEIMYRGPAHTLGDSFVWLEERDVMFTGDVVYVDRMLGTGPANDTANWISVFDAMVAYAPTYIVPGHGGVTDVAKATSETLDYLMYLRSEVGEVLEGDGTLEDALSIDQSRFRHLDVFEQIAKKNAQNVYMQMEWE